MDITFLGTGSGYPSPTRGASCIVLRREGTSWMFDCGEGSQTQMMKSSLRAGKISRIFITHLHGDHMFGLPGLLCTISQRAGEVQTDKKISIVGPLGLRRFVRIALELSRTHLGYFFTIDEIVPRDCDCPEGWQDWKIQEHAEGSPHPDELPGHQIEADDRGVWPICHEDGMSVVAVPLKHRVPSFGFVVQEDEKPGKLNVQLLKSLAVPVGPLCAELKKGNSVTSTTGQLVHPHQVIALPTPGRKVVIMGDSSDSSAGARSMQDADLLVHEVTLEDEMKESALLKGHSTPEMVGSLAKSLNVKAVIITHFSQRYRNIDKAATPAEDKDDEASDSVEVLLKQTMSAFGAPGVQAAEDLKTFSIL